MNRYFKYFFLGISYRILSYIILIILVIFINTYGINNIFNPPGGKEYEYKYLFIVLFMSPLFETLIFSFFTLFLNKIVDNICITSFLISLLAYALHGMNIFSIFPAITFLICSMVFLFHYNINKLFWRACAYAIAFHAGFNCMTVLSWYLYKLV